MTLPRVLPHSRLCCPGPFCRVWTNKLGRSWYVCSWSSSISSQVLGQSCKRCFASFTNVSKWTSWASQTFSRISNVLLVTNNIFSPLPLVVGKAGSSPFSHFCLGNWFDWMIPFLTLLPPSSITFVLVFAGTVVCNEMSWFSHYMGITYFTAFQHNFTIMFNSGIQNLFCLDGHEHLKKNIAYYYAPSYSISAFS